MCLKIQMIPIIERTSHRKYSHVWNPRTKRIVFLCKYIHMVCILLPSGFLFFFKYMGVSQ